MVTTTWVAGAGDWTNGSNWSNGVPTAADTAVFAWRPPDGYGADIMTGDGPSASLVITAPDGSHPFAGTHVWGISVVSGDGACGQRLGGGVLEFGSGTIASGAGLGLVASATLGSGELTLDAATRHPPIQVLTASPPEMVAPWSGVHEHAAAG